MLELDGWFDLKVWGMNVKEMAAMMESALFCLGSIHEAVAEQSDGIREHLEIVMFRPSH